MAKLRPYLYTGRRTELCSICYFGARCGLRAPQMAMPFLGSCGLRIRQAYLAALRRARKVRECLEDFLGQRMDDEDNDGMGAPTLEDPMPQEYSLPSHIQNATSYIS